MEGPENTLHDCVHEDDFKKTNKDIHKIKNELKKGNNLFKYITEELEIVKDALGVKTKENGDRDEQIKEIREKANDIGKMAEEKDDTLYEMVTDLRVDVAEIKGSMGLKAKKDKDRNYFKIAIYGAIAGALASGVIILLIEVLKYYTEML